jgi:hypothetical protein
VHLAADVEKGLAVLAAVVPAALVIGSSSDIGRFRA